MWRLVALSFLFVIGVAVAFACGDDESNEAPTATKGVASSEPTETRLETEGGESPVFWRAADDFESIVANEAYKVVFRITNGYDDPILQLRAVHKGDDLELTLNSDRADPVGDDLPGAYYPTFILLTRPGIWELTVLAGADQPTITVDVADASG